MVPTLFLLAHHHTLLKYSLLQKTESHQFTDTSLTTCGHFQMVGTLTRCIMPAKMLPVMHSAMEIAKLLLFLLHFLGHGSDLPFVFQTAHINGFNYTSDEMALSDSIIRYFTNFVKYGNPNGNGEPANNEV